MLPTFLIIGAQKSGTTSLYRYLQAHPDVFLPRMKEPDFFVEERNWGRGIAWYESLFDPAGDAIAIGEASTTYTMYPHYAGVPARIADTLPDVKLIYLLRDPVERTRSDYLHYRYPPDSEARQFFDRERRPIERALAENPLYLDTSRYAMQLEQHLEYVPRERILLVTTDELVADRGSTVRSVFEFIGVDPDKGPTEFAGEHNRTDELRVPTPTLDLVRRIPITNRLFRALPWRVRQSIGRERVDLAAGAMSGELRGRVESLLRDDVEHLRTYFGPEFDAWGLLDRND